MRSNTQKIERPKKNPGYLNFCGTKSPEIFSKKNIAHKRSNVQKTIQEIKKKLEIVHTCL